MNEFARIEDAYARNRFAADGGQIDVLALYAALADKAIANEYGQNLYHLAARHADGPAIRLLMAAGVKPRVDDHGSTPLHSLSQTHLDEWSTRGITGRATRIHEAAKLLLELGVNPRKKDDSDKIAYFEAGLRYNHAFITAVHEAGVKMDAIQSEGKNLLHAITSSLHRHQGDAKAVNAAGKTIRALLRNRSVRPDDQDIFGTTPVTYAQRSGAKKIAAILLGRGTSTATGGMALHEAVMNRDAEAVKALIACAADLDEESDTHHKTPLMLACEFAMAGMCELLLESGADANYTSGSDDTAARYLLECAARNLGKGIAGGQQDAKDLVKILRLLIAHGLDVNASVDAQGNTALNLLCQCLYTAGMHERLAQELIDAGCDVSLPNLDGRTPLMSFAMKGDEASHGMAELLLYHGATTTQVDRHGFTALMHAAAHPSKVAGSRIATLILQRDAATVKHINHAGESAVDIALRAGNETVAKLIVAKF